MSISALNWAWGQECPNATAKLVLIALADKANDDGECWPGMDTVADMVGISARQVSTHLGRLESAGLIVRRRRRSALGRLGRYVYHLAIGSALPVDQEKSTSGSALPLDHRKPTSGSPLPVEPVTTGSPASSTTGSPLPVKDQPKELQPKEEPKSDPDVSDDARRLTRHFAKAVKHNGHSIPKAGTPAHRQWLVDMDRLLRLGPPGEGGHVPTPDEVEQVIDWCAADTGSGRYPGESVTVRSVPKFRERFSELRLKAMRSQPEQRISVDHVPGGF